MAESIQIEGKRIDAAKVKSFLFSLANSIGRTRNLVGSAEVDQYGTQMSLVLPEGIFTVSMLGMKGGILC
jgi:hypothetical protein